ncbi:MAG: hypothetical protein U5Q16_03845 [Gammaproteobacteria bacterium]|nr:hypothetical protein [Gammaproteobacteria bacterium]
MSGLCLFRTAATTAAGDPVALSVLSERGLDELFDSGWAAMQERLDQPSAWFVSNGRLADAPAWRPHAEDEAFLVDARPGPAGVRYLLYVHPAIRWFGGHFPGRPLLPGVVQVDWAVRYAELQGFAHSDFAGLSGVKFPAPVTPGSVVAMTLSGAADRVAMRAETRAGVCARGTLHYRV